MSRANVIVLAAIAVMAAGLSVVYVEVNRPPPAEDDPRAISDLRALYVERFHELWCETEPPAKNEDAWLAACNFSSRRR